MTPDSIISLYRSFPSRVRSPTPAKTERPLRALAMLLINSMMSTVLPTPAPPKAPILPPFRKGQIRSMTLMPVSSTSVLVDCSSSGGAPRWMLFMPAQESSPRSSTASPSTLKIRPSTHCPTGTSIGRPVSRTGIPRRRPSVELMATARTQPSPMCCWTSRTRVLRLPSTS